MNIRGIDHVMIVTPGLADSRAEFESLGFTVAPLARHRQYGTANHLVVLQDTYIELLGLDPDAEPGAQPLGPVARSLAAGGGLAMLAMASDDARAFADELRAAGLSVTPPDTWARAADTPQGTVTARFTTFLVEGDPLPGFGFFCCQQHTREAVWCPEWMTHANGARRIVGLHRDLVSPTPGLADAYTRLVGADRVDADADPVAVTLGEHRLTFRTGQQREQGVIRLAGAPGSAGRRFALSSVPDVAIAFVDP